MNINSTIKVGALFKLDVYKELGEAPVKSLDWFPNMILDQGLRHLSGTSGYPRSMEAVAVGSGTSLPEANQTGLDAIVAVTDSSIFSTGGRNMSEKYAFGRKTYRFERGAAAGILGELCICTILNKQDKRVFAINRGRIKDALGQPTTLEVLADEFLEITVEFREYFQETFTGTFKLMKGALQVSEHAVSGRFCLSGDPAGFLIYPAGFEYAKSTIISASELPEGNVTKPSVSKALAASTRYADGKTYGAIQVGLDDANGYDHKSFFVPISNVLGDGGDNGYMWQIDPPIRKTNNQEITYNLNITWQRYEGT